MPALLELFKGTGSVGRAFEAEGWEVVSLDLLPRFEPSICCNILQWDYCAAFPPGHFQFVWASPVCTEYSKALTTRPRRLPEADALVLRTIEIIAHLDPPGHRTAEDPAVHGAPALGGRDLLQVRNSVQKAARGRTAGISGLHSAPADGGAVREGQPAATRAALQRSCCAVRRDSACGHGRACGAAEHSGLGGLETSPFFRGSGLF